MIPLDYVLAVALLTAPPVPAGGGIVLCRAEVRDQLGEGLSSLAPTVKDLAIRAEVMDHRESSYLLASPEEFVEDVELLRKRFRALAEAPPLDDCHRFPGRLLASELLEFNRAYRAHLVNCQAIEGTRRAELAEAVQETDQLYRIWDAIRDAHSECYYVTVRRQALRTLQQILGPEAYYRGTLPPHVPVWRFGRVD